jgi:hypothetical protein
MPPLVDSDIFCKLGVSSLLDDALAIFGVTVDQCGRLPALPHMLRRGNLLKQYGQAACAKLIPIAESMPIAPEAMSGWLDKFAAIPRVDAGEAQLLACAAEHSLILLTGDKRALVAIASVPELPDAVAGRIVTLEAVLLALCRRVGDNRVRAAVQPLLSADKTVQICFSGQNPQEGLESYFGHLQREVQPIVLWVPSAA